MKKEFIPYEQAVELKELGFDEHCFARYYQQDGNDAFIQIGEREIEEAESAGDDVTFECDAPLYQQAFRWFREKYKLQAEIIWRGDMKCFCYKTGKFKYGSHDFSKDDYKTSEEAELECLKKLIEIVKNK
jgi:hypothetical protein